MSKLKSMAAMARSRVLLVALAALPLIAAACNNGGGSHGY
jgi:hypothetical protein